MAALWLLFRLKSKAAFRNLWRDCKSFSGAVRAVFTIGFVIAMCSPFVVLMIKMPEEQIPVQYFENARFVADNILPLAIGWFVFVSVGSLRTSHSLQFSLAEIEFLFTGPFTRRQLLVYKLLGILTSTFAVCVPLSCFFGGSYLFFKGSLLFRWWCGFSMLFLAIVLFRLLGVLGGLARESLLLRLFSPFRKLVAGGFAMAAFYGMLKVRGQFDWSFLEDPERLFAVFKSVVETAPFQWLIAPFRIFTNLLTSPGFGEYGFWFSICTAANALVAWLILKTDKNFIESELHFAQARLAAMKQIQSTETAFIGNGKSGTLPMLPFWQGVGPLVWRQLQTFFRTRRFALVMSVLYFLFLIGLLVVSGDGRVDQNQSRFGLGISMLVMTNITLPILLPMGFQSDIKRIDLFKSLPFGSFQVTAGQLIAPMLAIVAIQYATIVIFLIVAWEYYVYWLAFFFYSPVLAIVVLCLVNSVVLLYPRMPDDGVVRELENVGHILVFVFLLAAVSTILITILGGVGYLVYLVTESQLAILVACWFVLAAAAVTGIWINSLVFKNFDVSRYQM